MDSNVLFKKKLFSLLKKYTVFIIFILFMANVGILTVIRLRSKAQTCFTQASINSDSRCLYILSGKVYEKGTRASPHHSHPCGQDVTSILPASHLNAMMSYLDPNYKGDVCTVVPTATEAPTQAPSSTFVPTVIPTVTSSVAECSLNALNNINCYLRWASEENGQIQTKASDFTQDNRIDLKDFEMWRRVFY